MKRIFLILLVFSLSQCADDVVSDQEKVLHLLTAGPWQVTAASVDGTAQTEAYENFQLWFSPSDFSARNGGTTWPASGAWIFEEGASRIIEREDRLLVTISSLTATTLVIEYAWDESKVGWTSGKENTGPVAYKFAFSRVP